MSVETGEASLYQKLGGYNNISAFSSAAFKKAFVHPSIKHIWAHMGEDRFLEEHKNFSDFLAREWGGPIIYKGRSMLTAHRGMGLTQEHWDGMMDCLYATYEEFGLPKELQEQVNATMDKFKSSVIGSPSYRDVVAEHPNMDMIKGMRSVGVIWPTPRNPRDEKKN